MLAQQNVVDRLRRLIQLLQQWLPWVALPAGLAGVVLVLRSQREGIERLEWGAAWRAFVVAAAIYALPPLTQGASFWLALRWLTGGRAAVAPSLHVWGRSYVVRYVPTGTLAIAYRLRERERVGATVEQVLAAFAYEHIGSLGAAGFVCLTIFATAAQLPPLIGLAVAVPALASVAAAACGVRGVEGLARRLGHPLSLSLPARRAAALVAVNAVGWLATGIAVYVLAAGIVDGHPGVRWLLGGYTVGYLVGFVTPLSPGGLGAREGALVALLGARYGAGVALTIALGVRLANVAGELLAVALIESLWAGRRLQLRTIGLWRGAGVASVV